jgi:Holliday junction resolvasome RuvABC endonuclease subunit
MLLALDLGTACGWATNAGGQIAYGTLDLKADRFSGGGMRFLKFRRCLEEFKRETHIDEIVYEQVRRHRGTDAAHCYGGLLATLTSWCEENAIPYSGRTVQSIKKFATGKGNADKGQMIAAAQALGFLPKDDNQADAIHILRLRLSEEGESICRQSNTGISKSTTTSKRGLKANAASA